MIWIIYRDKDTLQAPRAIPFNNDSEEVAKNWIEEFKDKKEIIDIAISD